MGKKYEQDLFYASSAIKVMEAKSAPKEILNKIIEAKDYEEAKRIFSDAKFGSGNESDFETALTNEQNEMYAAVTEILQDGGEEIVKVFKYQYDCQNIKAFAKAFVFSSGLNKDNLFSCGTLSPDEIETGIKYKTFDSFEKEFAQAAEKGCEAAAKENDPRIIDTELDKACFALMLRTAEESGIPFLTEAVKRRIDIVNISLFLRLKNRNGSKALLDDSLCDGGNIKKEKLSDAFESGDFTDALSECGFGELAQELKNSGGDEGVICEKAYLEKALETKYTPFGAAPIISYLMLKENEIKNYRVAMVGKKVNLSPEAIRKRICAVE